MAVSDPAEMRQLSQLELMGHLFRRAGFGATRDELEAVLAQGYEATLEEILIVADWGNERVQILRSDGAHLATLLGDATLSKWAREFIEASPDVAAKRQSAADLETEKRFWAPSRCGLTAQVGSTWSSTPDTVSRSTSASDVDRRSATHGEERQLYFLPQCHWESAP